MNLRSIVTVASWLVVAAFLGFIGWTAVHVIIDDVGGGQAAMLSPTDITDLLPTASSSVGPTLPVGQGSPAATQSPPGVSPTASAGSTSGPTSSSTRRPTAPGSAPTSTRNPQPTPSAVAGRSAIFTTTGGAVAATCRQSTISLNYARPNDGWQVEVGNRGPQELEVKFHSTRIAVAGKPTDSGSEVEIQLTCSAGVPVRN